MSNKGKKIIQTKKILNLFGINGLTDYKTKIFLCDLKEIDDLIEDFNKITNQNVTTVESAIKYLKDDLFDQCGIKYVTGRTSKSTYFSLVDTTESDTTLIDDFLFYKSEKPSNFKQIIDLLAYNSKLPIKYSAGYHYLMPYSASAKTGIIRINKKHDYYSELFIIIQYESIIKNIDNVIDCVKEDNIEQTEDNIEQTEYNKKKYEKINKKQIIYYYESKSNYLLSSDIFIKLNKDHSDYNNIELIILAGKCIVFDTSIRRDRTFSLNYESSSISSSISAKHNFDLKTQIYPNVKIINPPFITIKSICIESAILPKMIKIFQNGNYYNIDNHLIDCINISNNNQIDSKRFYLPFNDEKIGVSYKSPQRTDKFEIVLEFDKPNIDDYNQKGVIWFETYDYHIYYNWLKEKIKNDSYFLLNPQMMDKIDPNDKIYYVCPNNGCLVYSNIPNLINESLNKYKTHIKYDYEFELSSSEDRNEYDINLNIKTTKCINFVVYKSSVAEYNKIKDLFVPEYTIIFQYNRFIN